MGYAGLTPHGYLRKRITPASVALSTRNLMPEVISWSDKNIQNWIDEITARAEENPLNVEYYWQDDFSFGVFQIKVIRIDDFWAEADVPREKGFRLYSVVRPCDEPSERGQTEIILTVVNEHGYEDSIRTDRWKVKKPERSKYQHPGEPEEPAKEFKTMDEQHAEPIVIPLTTGKDQEELLVSFAAREGVGVEEEIVHTTRGHLNSTIDSLIEDGMVPGSIRVWKQLKMRMRVQIDVED
jgi:hypothetical protein